MTELRILGVTDEQTTCDRCGKVSLARTVIVGEAESGVEVGRYGTSCISHIMGHKFTARDADRFESHRAYMFRDALAQIRSAYVRPAATDAGLYVRAAVREAKRWARDDADRNAILDTIRKCKR